MIEKYLRRGTVEIRMMIISLIMLLFFVFLVPFILSNNNNLSNQLQVISDVEARAGRLLLKASAGASESRANLIHYLHNFFPDVSVALGDADKAISFLEATENLPIDSESQEIVSGLLADLATYQDLIRQVESSRQSPTGRDIELEAQALQLASDISVKLDQMAQASEIGITESYNTLFDQAQTRLIVLFVVYFFLLVILLLLIRLIRQSITRPIADLQAGADQFRQGNWETKIPVTGSDELTLLAETFNQMAIDLAESQIYLEDRVAQRTQALETSAEVSHNLSSILDQNAFSIAVVEQLQATFGYYYVQLYLLNDTQDQLFLKSATGIQGQKMLIRGHRIDLGQGLVGQAAVSKDIVIAPDVTQNPHWLSNPLLPETKSELAVPIISRDVPLGVLDIQHNVVDGINKEEIVLLRSISDQIAIALENARLFERIQQQANREALLNRVTQRIQLADSVEQVLQIAAQELGKALNAEYTTVQFGKQNQHANGYNKVE